MLSPVSLALLVILAPLQEPVPGIVRGQVRSESTSAPVAGARVELVGMPGPPAVADSGGYYLLHGVPPGRHVVRASHIDHDPLEVEVHVPAGGEFLLDFILEVRPVMLPRVTAQVLVVRGARDTVAATAPELGTAAIRVLEATPGVAELGIAEAARRFPSEGPIDPSEILYVRGTAADLKLVLLDGAPVYAPFHLAGLISPFETDVLRAASLYLGGAPSRFDGGLSYVLDMETRAARRSRGQFSGAVDLMSAEGMAEGPIMGRAGYLVQGRVLHGLGTQHLMDEGFPYGYADGLARVDMDVGTDGVLSVTGFWNRESVELDTAVLEPASWGNAAGSVRYRGTVLGTEAELTASYGDFGAAIPLGDRRPILARGHSRRARLNADFGSEIGDVRLRFGATHDWLAVDQRLEPVGSVGTESAAGLAQEAEGVVTGAYMDASVVALDRLILRGGVRADAFSLLGGVRVAPRVAATLLLTDRLVVKLTAGRYRQYVTVPEPFDGIYATGLTTRATRRPLAVASASHVVLGVDHDAGHGVRVGLESFVKRFEGLPSAAAPPYPIGARRRLTTTDTNASGVDLWVQRSSGRLQGWLGYSVAWIWSEEGSYALTKAADGRQLLSAGLSGPIGPDGEFELRFSYGAGLPYTAVPDVAMPEPGFAAGSFPIAFTTTKADDGGGSARPAEPYLRIDAEISHTWNTRLRETNLEVTPYLRVLNALDRRDALFYRYDGEGSLRPLGVLPVLPILGVEWRF